jgi:hypothetical protein
MTLADIQAIPGVAFEIQNIGGYATELCLITWQDTWAKSFSILTLTKLRGSPSHPGFM